MQELWMGGDPDQLARDFNRIITHYVTAWNKKRVVLVGYSLGSDVLPFALPRLPEETESHIKSLVLIGLSHTVRFEAKLKAVDKKSLPPKLLVLPELKKVRVSDILCIAATDEKESLCRDLDPPIDVRVLPGQHNFHGDLDQIFKFVSEKTGVIPTVPSRVFFKNPFA